MTQKIEESTKYFLQQSSVVTKEIEATETRVDRCFKESQELIKKETLLKEKLKLQLLAVELEGALEKGSSLFNQEKNEHLIRAKKELSSDAYEALKRELDALEGV